MKGTTLIHDTDDTLDPGDPRGRAWLLILAMGLATTACGDNATGPGVDTVGSDSDTGVTCTSDCTVVDTTSCAAGGFRTCELDAEGCLTWGPVQACPGTMTCSLGVCSDTCQDECAIVDVAVCEGNNVRPCGQFDTDTCLDLGDPSACPSGETCSSGVCGSTCQDECDTNGATECVGAGVRTCGNQDGDTCLEWSAVVACEANNECQASSCEAGACKSKPIAEGSACSGGPCTSGGTCASGTCIGAVSGCGPGEACVGDVCTCETVINAGTGLATIPLVLEAADVIFSYRINGVPAPTNLPDTELGEIRIRHRNSITWTPVHILGKTPTSDSWRLVPGIYDVEYRKASEHSGHEGILTPENLATVYSTITVPRAGGNVSIDVPTAQVIFQPRINGQPAPTNLPATERGELFIQHEGSSEWFFVSSVGGDNGTASWRLLTGTYRYQYHKGSQHAWRSGVLTPENPPTAIGTFAITASGGAIQLNLMASTVTFAARINGQPAPTNLPPTELGVLSIKHRGSVTWTEVGELGGQMIGPDWRLIVGTYDVQYRTGPQHTWRDGILTPENPDTIFTTIEVPATDGEIQIPIETATVTFQARLNGQPAPQNLAATELGILSIKHQGSTIWTDIGNVGGQMIGPNWRLITGTYDVQYRRGAQHTWRAGVLTPENPETVTGTLVVPAQGGLIPVNISAATVTFQARINGQPAPVNAGDTELGELEIRHRGSTEWIELGNLGRPLIGPDWRLLTGIYDLRYSRSADYEWREGILAPENPDTVFGQITITDAGGQIALNVPAADTQFTVRLNGQPGPGTLPETERGRMDIRHRGQTEWVGAKVIGGAEDYKWRLVAGDYQVQYSLLSAYRWRAGILTPENPEVVTSCFKLVGP